LRARPVPTILECLSDASFLGKLLALPADVRLDWKVIARYKHSSLFGLIISNEGNKFYNIDIWSKPLLIPSAFQKRTYLWYVYTTGSLVRFLLAKNALDSDSEF
jgi:hypothetical protein